MLQATIELLLAPLLVAASVLAGRRWGPHVGGVVSAFPAIVGPVLLIAALDHGAHFAARAADGTLLGLVALSTFALTYARVAQRAGWPLTLLTAWAVAAATAAAVLSADGVGPPIGLLAAGVSLFAAHRLIGAGQPALAAPPAATRSGSLPLRMLATALLVTALTAASQAFGAGAGGILAALPVLASVLAVATHRSHGAAAVLSLLRGMLSGMAGFVAFCEVLVLIIAAAGLPLAFALATAAALGVQGATLVSASPRANPARPVGLSAP